MFQLKYSNLFSDLSIWMCKACLLGIMLKSHAKLKGIIPGVIARIAKSPSSSWLSNNVSLWFIFPPSNVLMMNLYLFIFRNQFVHLMHLTVYPSTVQNIFREGKQCTGTLSICLSECINKDIYWSRQGNRRNLFLQKWNTTYKIPLSKSHFE